MREIITIDASPIVRLDNGPVLDRTVGRVRITVADAGNPWATESLTGAWAKLREADQAVAWAEYQRDQLLREYNDRYSGVWCDHPNTSGPWCDTCDAYVDPSEEILADEDHWRVRGQDESDLLAEIGETAYVALHGQWWARLGR